MDINKTCAFTGHRNVGDDLDINALSELVQTLIDNGVDTFLDGMARGFDLLAAETVIKLKEKNPHIKLIACVPCPNQEKYFSDEDKELYYSVLDKCNEVKILSDRYYKGCMHVRNRFMVDNSSKLVAYDRAEDGGTVYTVSYAAKHGKEIFII